MYVSDCIQYLEEEVPNAGPEWTEDEIIYALKILKDTCMAKADMAILDWRSQYLEEATE